MRQAFAGMLWSQANLYTLTTSPPGSTATRPQPAPPARPGGPARPQRGGGRQFSMPFDIIFHARQVGVPVVRHWDTSFHCVWPGATLTPRSPSPTDSLCLNGGQGQNPNRWHCRLYSWEPFGDVPQPAGCHAWAAA